jgi:hypothetical protein
LLRSCMYLCLCSGFAFGLEVGGEVVGTRGGGRCWNQVSNRQARVA